VLGRLAPEPSPARLARYVRRHPTAAAYAGFKDFRLYRMVVTRAHLVAGFGRISWIGAAALLAAGGADSPLATQEAELLDQINKDQAAMLDRCAAALCGRAGEGWRLTGIDIDGADLRCGGEIARLDFLTPVADREAARQAFAALAQSALRGQPSH
jgi:heme oxygenase (biliverdin-IX-beta and delta-forming)